MTEELDGSLHHEDIANDEENGDGRDNLSFMTVDYADDHARAKAAAAAIGNVESLLDSSLEFTMASNSGGMPKSSVYEKVKYHDDIGKLVLTDAKITFHPYDGGAPIRGSFVARNHEIFDGSHSWKWKNIMKHKITPASSSKAKLKLVSMDKKSVVFIFYNREQLELIRKDVSAHLKQAHSAQEVIMEEDASERVSSGNNQPKLPLEGAHEATALLGNPDAAMAEHGSVDRGNTRRINFHLLAAVGVVVLILIGIKVFSSASSGAVARFWAWTTGSINRALSLAPTDEALQSARGHTATLAYFRNNLRG
jgi:TFIIH p62 subunit, N-terminal domain